MNGYLRDVLTQPDSLEAALASYASQERRQGLEKLAEGGWRNVLFVGMGSSHFCAFGASQYLTRHGFCSEVKSAGNFLHYEAVPRDTLLVLISQSGESAEIVKIIETLPEGSPVVAITNDGQSTLGRRGDYTFVLGVEEEEAVTTRTYLASLVAVHLLALALAGELSQGSFQELSSAIGALRRFLSTWESAAEKIAAFFPAPSYLCLIGRGPSLSSVRAGALFLREVVKYPALDFDGGEFRHGPLEMVEEGFAGIVFAPQGPTQDISLGLALDIAQKGGRVLLVTGAPTGTAHPNILEVPVGETPEALSPLVTVAPVQLLANYLAEARGVEVGKFRWGAKITRVE